MLVDIVARLHHVCLDSGTVKRGCSGFERHRGDQIPTTFLEWLMLVDIVVRVQHISLDIDILLRGCPGLWQNVEDYIQVIVQEW